MAGRMLPPVVATLAASDEDLNKTLDNADARMITTAALMDDLGKDHKLNIDSMNSDMALRSVGDEASKASDEIKKIEPSSDGASDGLDRLDKSASAASKSMGSGSGGGGLLAALLPILPALVPIAGVATGASIALAGMATAGIAGLGAFALAAGPQLTTMKTQMGGLLTSFQAVSAPTVLPVLNNAVGLFGTALQAANPLVGATSTALLNLESRAKSALQSPAWAQFSTYIDASAGPAINTFGSVLGNLGHGFGNLLIAFAPVETQMEQGLVHLSQGFLNWTSSTGGLHSFVTWFQGEAPQVGQLIENLARLVALALPAFGGWGQILISVANPLLSLVDALLRVNPVIGEVAAALILGGVAWSKWGDGIKVGLDALGTFGSKANIAVTSLLGVGSSGTAAAAGVTGAAGASAGLVIGLSALALLAVPLAATFAGMAIGSSISKNYTDQLNSSVARMTATMSGAGANTIPQMNQAITANRALIADLTNKNLYAGASTDGLTVKQNEAVAAYVHGGIAGATYVASIQKITGENKTLQTSIATQNANLDLLSSKYGISKDSALNLANTLGFNLNKQLTGLQVAQVGAEFDQMSQSAGITQAALQNLATTSKLSMSAVSQSITNAESATQKSFTAAGDSVKAFSGFTTVTGQELQMFYGAAVNQAQTFTANIRTAISDGYDPTLISQLLTAGPAQAGPLLQSLVDNASNGMVQTVAGATSALNSLNVQAVQEQRITYEAVTAGSSQMAADVGNAFAIQQQVTLQGATATAASVAHALNMGVSTVQQISDEYSLGLPNAFQAQQLNAYLKAMQQAQSGAQGLVSQIAVTQNASNQHAAALPNSMFGRVNDSFAGAVANSWGVVHGLDSGAGAVAGAASNLSQTAYAFMHIPDTTWIGFNAGNAVALGLLATIGAVQTAASQVSAAAIQGVQAGAAAVNAASSSLLPHFAAGGTVNSATVLLAGESGTETILPWDDPGRVAQLLGAMPASAFSALDSGVQGSGGGGTLAPAVSGGHGPSITVGQIVIQGVSDPRAAAIAVRNELLQMGRGVPNLWGSP